MVCVQWQVKYEITYRALIASFSFQTGLIYTFIRHKSHTYLSVIVWVNVIHTRSVKGSWSHKATIKYCLLVCRERSVFQTSKWNQSNHISPVIFGNIFSIKYIRLFRIMQALNLFELDILNLFKLSSEVCHEVWSYLEIICASDNERNFLLIFR